MSQAKMVESSSLMYSFKEWHHLTT